ncbi:MAG: hypothetical protein JKY55_17285 [Aliivibrio sp.]|uniref:hypothetical protein n=1 Tax=Aliivibrio sp. TaxID=1872443 RepID=UPI001A3F0B43|nr:hypothetical protein [Aliivibrio sp.]
MNITTQTSGLAQSAQLVHNGVLVLNTPRNNVKAAMVGQTSQPFKQLPNVAQFAMANIKPVITRVRLVMHDACVLSVKESVKECVKTSDFSLAPALLNTPALEQVYFWKRNQGGISND